LTILLHLCLPCCLRQCWPDSCSHPTSAIANMKFSIDTGFSCLFRRLFRVVHWDKCTRWRPPKWQSNGRIGL
jgi:hypothetical protein